MSNTIDHKQLWLRVKEGDKSAFDRLYDLHVQALFAVVHRHIDNRADAEDIVQEVFLDFWEQKEQITIERSVFKYLYRKI
ncbi:MAG: hypothetical protein JST68_22165 [Bacteroidetes bacterium]|nr:hypothetical protein [Bacteroidota bacterium]